MSDSSGNLNELNDLTSLRNDVLERCKNASSVAELEDIRILEVGRNGRIKQLLKQIGGFEPAERKQAGQALNALNDEVTNAINSRKAALEDQTCGPSSEIPTSAVTSSNFLPARFLKSRSPPTPVMKMSSQPSES